MKEIDKRYEKVDKEASKSFELKIEKLIQDEEDLKEKLKNSKIKLKKNWKIIYLKYIIYQMIVIK